MRAALAAAVLPFAACGGTAAAAAPVAAQARADLRAPLTLVNSAPLSFGTFAPGPSAGTVVLNPDDGSVTATGGVTMLGAAASPASFSGTALSGKHVKVRVPTGRIVLKRVGGTETMTVATFTIDGRKNDKAVVGGTFSFRVGGTLSVGAAQADGLYEGSFEVMVENF